jgi:hypothetical protein
VRLLGQRTMITGLSGAAVADHDDFGEPAT